MLSGIVPMFNRAAIRGAVAAPDAAIGEGATIVPLVVIDCELHPFRAPLDNPVASDARGRCHTWRRLPRLSRHSHWLGMPRGRPRRPSP